MSKTNENMNSTIGRASDAIIELVSTSVAGAGFDTTIRAIVQDKVDSATGKYKLQYQDSVMYAFVDDVKTNYSKGTEVYVLIPKNDFTSDKRIIGSVKTLGEDYTLVLTEEDKYKKIGASAFGEENNKVFEINIDPTDNNSQKTIDLIGSTGLTVDPNFMTYLHNENTEAIWLEATFDTDIAYNADITKKYSLSINFITKDNKTVTASINQDNVVGIPFGLRDSKQIVIFDFKGEDGTSSIDWSQIDRISSVKLTTTELSGNDYVKVKNIKLYAVSALTQEQLNAPYAYIFTPKGTIVSDPGQTKSLKTVTLKGTLRINQQVQTDVKYFWFIEDLTINKDSGGKEYHDYGGRGWRLLNGVEENTTDGTFTVNNTDKDTLWVYDGTWDENQNPTGFIPDKHLKDQVAISTPTQRYKCVIAKDKDSRY